MLYNYRTTQSPEFVETLMRGYFWGGEQRCMCHFALTQPGGDARKKILRFAARPAGRPQRHFYTVLIDGADYPICFRIETADATLRHCRRFRRLLGALGATKVGVDDAISH